MATLEEIYSFEKNFEDAAETFLEAATGLEVYRSASDETFITPRIEIEFLTGEATEPIDAPIPLGLVEFRKYDATFFVRIITDPSAAGQGRDVHLAAVASTRVVLLSSKPNWDGSTLPLYGLKYIRPTATARSVAGDFQVTELTFEIRFSIRDNVWPTTTTTTTTTAAP